MHRVFQWTVTLLLAVAPQGASAATLISEVFYDAVGSDNGLSFVELYGAPGSSLDGMFLEGINGSNGAAGPTIALSGVFPADGIWLLADDVGDGTSSVAGAHLIANFDFQNGPDSIVLRTADAVLDAVGYGSSPLARSSQEREQLPLTHPRVRASRAYSRTSTPTTTRWTSSCWVSRPRAAHH